MATLRAVHALTACWPHRPGFASTRDLLTASRGGGIDLSQMPASAVTAYLRAWTALGGIVREIMTWQ